MADLTREEQFLSGIAEGSTVELKPITRREQYLAKIAGQDVEVPDPITREEMLLKQIADGGGGGSSVMIEPLTVTANGTTTAPAGKAYSPVTVNVPGPNLVALTATDNDTTYDPADYNADGFSSVSVEIAVPQVYVAQKQVNGSTVVYEFGVSVTNCVIAPLQSEASQIGVGMDLNFSRPIAINFRASGASLAFDEGNFGSTGYSFTANNIPVAQYPSALYAVAPN